MRRGVYARRLMRTFRDAAASSRKTARSLRDLGVEDDVEFRRVAGEGVFINTHGDVWYLDEERATLYVSRRRRRALVAIAIAVAFVALIAVFKLG